MKRMRLFIKQQTFYAHSTVSIGIIHKHLLGGAYVKRGTLILFTLGALNKNLHKFSSAGNLT